jgi:competence ComEA-like helix-hairpin-helix protein
VEKQEKKTKVSGVYLVLAALTVLFAVSLVFLHKTAYEGASHGNYTVTTQDKTDEITAPTRVVTLVNVNTATAEELETLTGIGPSLAQAIIDYRAEHGDLAAEDLLNVKGIGEAKLEGFRAEITFTEEVGDENSGG